MKKSMKKRSLMSAVAMLIVSAIVLTTATYAWFSMSNAARVEGLEVNVDAQSGLEISVNGGLNYYSFINKEIFETDASITLADLNLVPVDGLIEVDDTISFRKGTLADDVVTMSAAAANADYLEFSLTLRTGEDGTVSFTQGTGKQSAFGGSTTSAIAYASLSDTNGTKIYAANPPTAYNAIKSTVTETGVVNGIATTAADLEAVTIQSSTIDNHTVAVTANDPTTITIRIWIEGQDVDCKGSFNGGTIAANLFLNFEPTVEP